MVKPGSVIAGIWNNNDFPPPVGIQVKTSFLDLAAFMAAFWF